ncbi:MAG TPA: SpoIIE family protein phosphatase [Symbiobacteriaceae bacterium]
METFRRFGRLWKPNFYAGMLVGFLLGRALPEAQVGPLGIAFYAAVRGAGFGPLAAIPVGLAVVAGSATALPLHSVLWIGAALWAAHFAATALGVGAKGSSPLGAGLVAALAVAIPTVAVYIGSTVQPALWVGVACLLAPIFTLGILDVASGGLFRGAVADSPVPVVIIIAAAVCGLDRLVLMHIIPLQDAAAGLMVLTFAYIGGPALGTAAGAVLGISFLVGGSMVPMAPDIPPAAHSMAYVMAGLLAGTFRDLSKSGVGVAFYLGLVTFLLVTAQQATGLVPVIYGGAAATALFLLIPRRWMARMPAAFASQGLFGPTSREEGTATESLTVVGRVRSLSRVLREVSRAFLHVATVETPADEDEGRVFDQAAERVCHACSLNRRCWDKEFHRTHQAFSDLWAQVDAEGPLTVQPPPEGLEFCIYPAEVASTLNYLHDLHRSRHQWERRLAQGRIVAGDYVKNAARILERFADETGGTGDQTALPPVLKVVCGVARLPKRGSQVSGDSYAASPLGEQRYLMALSDGMGVGSDAASESRQCVQLLQEVLSAGFNTELAVNTVNSVMLLRSGEESFVTVDLSLVDLGTGRVEFVKIGAAPSFLKRGRDVTIIQQSTVPVGIIDQVVVEPEFRLLRPGDIIVMVTDGIWDVSKDDIDKERWILHHLSRQTATDPEEIAENLLARALDLMPDAGDDMTVLVARVDANGRLEPEAKRPVVDSWVPARRAPKFSEKPSARPKR